MTCPGHRRTAGKLLGLCVTCDLQDDAGQMEPAVTIRLEGIAGWQCANRVYTAPVLLAHRFASQAASAANSAAIDSSARTSTARSLASAQA